MNEIHSFIIFIKVDISGYVFNFKFSLLFGRIKIIVNYLPNSL